MVASSSDSNPRLSPAVRWFFIIVALVVVFGSGLLLLPDLIRPRWPWVISPFNAAFLGGVYLSELVLLLTLMITNRWSPARLVLPMALCFTLVVSVVSGFYADRLSYDRWAAPAWWVAYVGSVVVTGYYFLKYRRLPPANSRPLPTIWRGYLLVEGAALSLYGLAMLIFPAPMTSFWPWKIDDFHAQVYSAVFLTGGVGTLLLARAGARAEFLTLGLTQIALGFFSIIGLIMTDINQNRVKWSEGGTLGWLAIFTTLLLTGLALTGRAVWWPEVAAELSTV